MRWRNNLDQALPATKRADYQNGAAAPLQRQKQAENSVCSKIIPFGNMESLHSETADGIYRGVPASVPQALNVFLPRNENTAAQKLITDNNRLVVFYHGLGAFFKKNERTKLISLSAIVGA